MWKILVEFVLQSPQFYSLGGTAVQHGIGKHIFHQRRRQGAANIASLINHSTLLMERGQPLSHVVASNSGKAVNLSVSLVHSFVRSFFLFVCLSFVVPALLLVCIRDSCWRCLQPSVGTRMERGRQPKAALRAMPGSLVPGPPDGLTAKTESHT